jgi:hypothetical protein
MWPFSDPENLAVISIHQIVRDGEPVLHVVHDADDGGWQFLGWDDADIEDSTVVALRQIVQLDESIAALADLPPGWHAWRRTATEPWEREAL